MLPQAVSRSAKTSLIFGAVIVVLALAGPIRAAQPFTSATVTRVENKVSYGQMKANRASTRAATARDVVRANDFLLSETDSRAELRYEDGSIVRIGQNTVFSFDASTRTLSFDKGTFVFFIPRGQGGCTIKTPSLTASITGCSGKGSYNPVTRTVTILLWHGTGKVIEPPGPEFQGGEFIRLNPDGTFFRGAYDPLVAYDGILPNFNGRIQVELATETLTLRLDELDILNSRERATILGFGLELHQPLPVKIMEEVKEEVPVVKLPVVVPQSTPPHLPPPPTPFSPGF